MKPTEGPGGESGGIARWLPPAQNRHTTPLSLRQIVFLLAGVALLMALSWWLRDYLYPWLGAPVFGLSGLGPFYIGALSAVFLVSQLDYFRKRTALMLFTFIVLTIAFTVALIWIYGRMPDLRPILFRSTH